MALECFESPLFGSFQFPFYTCDQGMTSLSTSVVWCTMKRSAPGDATENWEVNQQNMGNYPLVMTNSLRTGKWSSRNSGFSH